MLLNQRKSEAFHCSFIILQVGVTLKTPTRPQLLPERDKVCLAWYPSQRSAISANSSKGFIRGRQAAKIALYLSTPNSQSCICLRCMHKGLVELLWRSDFSIKSSLESKFSRTQGSSLTIRCEISEGSRAFSKVIRHLEF
jgi:hypothetical protein